MCNDDLDIRDIEEFARPDDAGGPYSDFFLDTYPLAFPEAYQQDVFEFFRYSVHPYRRCFDTPAASPKNQEIESAVKNRGKKGGHTFVREGRDKFVLRSLREWMFHPKHEHRKHYYTSDRRQVMLMFDVDCHLAYQTPAVGEAARSVIAQAFGDALGVPPAFVASRRGQNGYLKVDIGRATPEQANAVFADLQHAVRLLLARHTNVADFEVKGTITWVDEDGKLRAGVYGKLPTCSHEWSCRWFEEFRKSRTVKLGELNSLINKIDSVVGEEDVAKCEVARHRAFTAHYLLVQHRQRWKLGAEYGSAWVEDNLVTYRGEKWIARSLLTGDTLSDLWPDHKPVAHAEATHRLTEQTRPTADVTLAEPPRPAVAHLKAGFSPKRSRKPDSLRHEPDSFERQRDALLVYARSLKRVPGVDEALSHIRANGLYTGSWDENRSRRKARVRDILKFIAQSFDAGKCSERTARAARLESWAGMNATKFLAWAKEKFPHGLTRTKHRADEYGGITAERQTAPPDFIGVFVAVCEFALVHDKNEDGSLPHDRAEAIWTTWYEKNLVAVPFCGRKWAVCRDELEKHGIVVITDRAYESGKAMRWGVGRYFPGLGLWKTKREASRLDPVSWVVFNDEENEEHNSLLQQPSTRMRAKCSRHPIRPPPHLIDSLAGRKAAFR